MLLQYLKFSFPLSLTSPDQPDNTHVKNHYSATQYPVAIQEYLHKETQLGVILGSTPLVDSKHFTRPKDTHKRRVIPNLSHPYGASYDCIGVSPRHDAMGHFQQLHNFLQELGLPINMDKFNPPCKDLICLGIRIQIPEASLGIDPEKVKDIHNECLHVTKKTYLFKKNFQSLLRKLIYLHKCVVPVRIFINRMLDLFCRNTSKKKIHLTTEFFRDLQWFDKCLPQFNGVTTYKKPIIHEADTLHLDACLTGIGGI